MMRSDGGGGVLGCGVGAGVGVGSGVGVGVGTGDGAAEGEGAGVGLATTTGDGDGTGVEGLLLLSPQLVKDIDAATNRQEATTQGFPFIRGSESIGRAYATLAGESFAASKRSRSQGGIWIGRNVFMSTTTATLRARKTGRAPTAPS
jgi:hypothetical protein